MMKHVYPDGGCLFQDNVSSNLRTPSVKKCPNVSMSRYAQLTRLSIINNSFLSKYILYILFEGLLKKKKKERRCH